MGAPAPWAPPPKPSLALSADPSQSLAVPWGWRRGSTPLYVLTATSPLCPARREGDEQSPELVMGAQHRAPCCAWGMGLPQPPQ